MLRRTAMVSGNDQEEAGAGGLIKQVWAGRYRKLAGQATFREVS